jgi:hypothetical protein
MLSALGTRAWAQVGGDVGGIVKDNSGAAIPGATVTITNTSTNVSVTQKTGAEGNYRAVNLQPAPYEISVEAAGFGNSKKNLTIVVGTDLALDFTLGVAGVSENVTVTAESGALLVEAAKSQPASLVDGQQIADLPNLSRQFLVLAQTMPGAAPIPNGRFGPTKFGGIADQRSGYTTIVDGATIDDATWGSPVINVTQDAVQEFKVYRNQFDAQYGSAMNAVVNVVSKSGGDQFHGTGYYFGRDVALNARNAFATSTPPFSQTRTGGTFGGPVAKMKNTYFFGAFEYLHLSTANIVALPPSNPFASEENGNYPVTQTETFADFKLDHRFSDTNSLYLRYAYNKQYTPGGGPPNSTAQIDNSIANSAVLEDNWIISPTMVNTARYAFLNHNLFTVPVNYDLGIIRPSYTFGQNYNDPQYFPRQNHYLYDTVFINKAKHDIKFGADLTLAHSTDGANFYENGQFTFTTDSPFDINNPATWPVAFQMQQPGNFIYDSKQIGAFIQDDWRILPNLRLNLGFRYDLDTNMRDNAFYAKLLADPAFAGLNHFISNNRGMDLSGWQPRFGIAWDTTGDGKLVVRGGFGRYYTRDRPWFEEQAEQQTATAAIRITNPAQLMYYPNIPAVLGGLTLEQYVAAGGARTMSILPDYFSVPYSLNFSAGFSYKISNVSAVTVDAIHDHALHELGATDLNLPLTGAITATNPRPLQQFGQVESTIDMGQSRYDAVEVQYRARLKGLENLTLSYTYSRSILNAVTFYNQFSGTDRTPDNYGFNPTNTPNNLSLTFTTIPLPGKIVLSGVFRGLSTGPFSVSAGIDLDGDGNTANDRPKGLPVTVGQGDVNGQVALINAFRANPCSFVYYSTVTCTAKPEPPISKSLLNLIPLLDLDLRLTRLFSIGEHKRVEVFFESYNTTNHVTPTGGATTMTSPALFVRTGALDPRQLQWGTRFSF